MATMTTTHEKLGTVKYNRVTKRLMAFNCGALDIAQMVGPNADNHAAHIVRCVNSHEALVEALKACYVRLASHDDQSVPELLLARAALALVEEQAPPDAQHPHPAPMQKEYQP